VASENKAPQFLGICCRLMSKSHNARFCKTITELPEDLHMMSKQSNCFSSQRFSYISVSVLFLSRMKAEIQLAFYWKANCIF